VRGNGLGIAGWGHPMDHVLWSVGRSRLSVPLGAGNSCDLSQVQVLLRRSGIGPTRRLDMGLDRG